MNTDKIYAQKIASEYAPESTSKVKALKRLDKKAKSFANGFAYTFGIISSLIFGTGLSLALKVIGNGSNLFFGIGIGVGALGIILMSVTYPIYKKLISQGKKKYANDILELAKQISEE